MDRNKKGDGQAFNGTLGDSAARARFAGAEMPKLGSTIDMNRGSSVYNPKGPGQVFGGGMKGAGQAFTAPPANKGMGQTFQAPMGGWVKGPGQQFGLNKGLGQPMDITTIGAGDTPWLAALRTIMNRYRNGGGW